MTRRSKREIERALGELDEASSADSIAVVWRHPRTGEFVDADDEPVDPDADTVVAINDRVVMGRERAEEAGREILGPAEDASPGRDTVRVSWRDR